LVAVAPVVVVGFLAWGVFFPAPVDDCQPSGDLSRVTREFCHMDVQEIQLLNDEGRTISIRARIADEEAEQRAGFQKIAPDVLARSFVLFVFSQDVTGKFHMCNVAAPLEIAWFARDGSIVDLKEMEPGPVLGETATCDKLYGPYNDGAFRYALEAPKGFYRENRISRVNSRLVLRSVK
jgi:uncharacterized membrane protein (UPF0127 family)